MGIAIDVDADLPKPLALGTEVEMRVYNGTVGAKRRAHVQHGRVTDRVWFYDLQQWGYSVRWDGGAQFNPGEFIVRPFLEVV